MGTVLLAFGGLGGTAELRGEQGVNGTKISDAGVTAVAGRSPRSVPCRARAVEGTLLDLLW